MRAVGNPARLRSSICTAHSTREVIEALEQRKLLSAVIYRNDFENAVGNEWTKTTVATAPSGPKYLGQFAGGNNGWVRGTTTSWVAPRSGQTGSALQLGTTGYVEVENDQTLTTPGDVTVSAWVKFNTSSPTSSTIVDSVPTSGLGGFTLGTDSGGRLYLAVRSASGTAVHYPYLGFNSASW